MATFAKQMLTNKYKERPKSSLRMRMAKLRFPKAMAPAYFTAYGKCPDAARMIPTIFNVDTNVKSFLANRFGNMKDSCDGSTPICIKPQLPEDPFRNLLDRWRCCGWCRGSNNLFRSVNLQFHRSTRVAILNGPESSSRVPLSAEP